MRLGRDVLGKALIGGDVEEEPPAFRDQTTPLRRRRRMRYGALPLVGEKRFGDLFTQLAIRVAALGPFRRSLRVIRALELVVLGRGAVQLLYRRRRVVHRRCVHADDAALFVGLEPRSKLQACDALPIDRHEVQSVGRNLDGDLLDRPSIAAGKKRRLSSILREEVNRRHRERARHLGAWRRYHRHRTWMSLGQARHGLHGSFLSRTPIIPTGDVFSRSPVRLVKRRSQAEGLSPTAW